MGWCKLILTRSGRLCGVPARWVQWKVQIVKTLIVLGLRLCLRLCLHLLLLLYLRPYLSLYLSLFLSLFLCPSLYLSLYQHQYLRRCLCPSLCPSLYLGLMQGLSSARFALLQRSMTERGLMPKKILATVARCCLAILLRKSFGYSMKASTAGQSLVKKVWTASLVRLQTLSTASLVRL